MSVIDRFMKTIHARGLTIKPGREPGQLLLSGPDKEKTADVIEAVKVFKPLLLERIKQVPREPETEAERRA